MEEEEKETHQEQEQEQEKEEKETEQELEQENKEIEGTDKKYKTNMNDEHDDNHIKNETTSTLSPIRLENEVTRTEEIDRDEVEKTASILSNVRMDWMFSDSEPDEPPNSPKQVHCYSTRQNKNSKECQTFYPKKYINFLLFSLFGI